MRYFGGKSLLAGRLTALFPNHKTFVETHAGSASVLLGKDRSHVEILNDKDDLIVNVLRCVRDDEGRLFESLRNTPYARREYVDAAERTEDPWEQARRTIVRSFMGIGADAIHRETGFRGYPHNRKREKDSTCAHEWATYLDSFPAFRERLRGVMIENIDALEIIDRFDEYDTLFYVDPPYVMSTRVDGRNRYGHEMTDDDHRALLRDLWEVQGMVVLSGYQSELYNAILHEWTRIDIDFRGKVESVWLNGAAEEASRKPSLFDLAGNE